MLLSFVFQVVLSFECAPSMLILCKEIIYMLHVRHHSHRFCLLAKLCNEKNPAMECAIVFNLTMVGYY
jgi:hypothetical protein